MAGLHTGEDGMGDKQPDAAGLGIGIPCWILGRLIIGGGACVSVCSLHDKQLVGIIPVETFISPPTHTPFMATVIKCPKCKAKDVRYRKTDGMTWCRKCGHEWKEEKK